MIDVTCQGLPFAGPGQFRLRITTDFTLEKGVATLGKTRVPEDLFENRRRAIHQRPATNPIAHNIYQSISQRESFRILKKNNHNSRENNEGL